MNFPERPTANPWQLLGQGLSGAAGILEDEQKQQNLLQDMVERRTARALEQQRQEKELALKEKEAADKAGEEDHKRKVQLKLAGALTKGVPAGEYDENLVEGRPDPLLGMRPDAPQKQVYRPADENDVMAIAAEGMDPYQTAALYNKPVAAAATHGYRMDEIGARGATALSVADIRAKAMERAAHIRATYASKRGAAAKDWKFTMQDSQAKLTDIESDLADLELSKPKRSWDLQPWNTEMARLVGQKKFYEAQIYKASQAGESIPDGESPDIPSQDPPPPAPGGGAPQPRPQPPPARGGIGAGKALDKNTAAKYMAAANGDKAKARQMAAADGWKF